SIHAPVKGATAGLLHVVKAGHVSIHAPVKGATQMVRYFQAAMGFRSTPREGGDVARKAALYGGAVSIHAPGKGATCAPAASRRTASCFDPRPREGGDPTDLTC